MICSSSINAGEFPANWVYIFENGRYCFIITSLAHCCCCKWFKACSISVHFCQLEQIWYLIPQISGNFSQIVDFLTFVLFILPIHSILWFTFISSIFLTDFRLFQRKLEKYCPKFENQVEIGYDVPVSSIFDIYLSFIWL